LLLPRIGLLLQPQTIDLFISASSASFLDAKATALLLQNFGPKFRKTTPQKLVS